MKKKKIRHEFLADADVTALLNRFVQNSSATKTDIIVQALRVFSDRGIETEFTQQTAMRFDRLSRELEDVKHRLVDFLQDYENDKKELNAALHKGRLTFELLRYFVRLNVALSAHIPMPEGEAKAVSNQRWNKLADQVDSQFAGAKQSSPPTEERNNS